MRKEKIERGHYRVFEDLVLLGTIKQRAAVQNLRGWWDAYPVGDTRPCEDPNPYMNGAMRALELDAMTKGTIPAPKHPPWTGEPYKWDISEGSVAIKLTRPLRVP